jgi:hypothetical protein
MQVHAAERYRLPIGENGFRCAFCHCEASELPRRD